MPELPEVEWMVAKLHPWCAGKIIERAEVLRGDYLPGEEAKIIVGARIEKVTRRGKYIRFHLDRGIMLGHNSMSGYWDSEEEPGSFDYVEGARQSTAADVRVRLHLPDRLLRFHDARLFGSIRFFAASDPWTSSLLSALGPDAVETPHATNPMPWSIINLIEATAKSKRAIKQILLDQGVVAGIGNIYATEILWKCKIDPRKKGKDLTTQEQLSIMITTRAILKEAMEKNLNYPEYLKVYREQTCSRCQGEINCMKQGGRSTYWCPTCQNGKEK